MDERANLRVFLDSNILFSGLYSTEGPPGKIVDLYVRGEISVLVSTLVLEELVRTIRTKLPKALPALERLLTSVPPEVVADPSEDQVFEARRVVNVRDAPILAAAVLAAPDFFVTGDMGYFRDNPEKERYAGPPIVTPAQFIAYYLSSGA